MKMILPTAIAAAMIFGTGLAHGDAAALYNKSCASCHGKDGKGETRMGKRSGARDYTDPKVQASFTDAEGIKAILEGATRDGKEVMKGYSDKISAAEAKELMAYIRKFKP